MTNSSSLDLAKQIENHWLIKALERRKKTLQAPRCTERKPMPKDATVEYYHIDAKRLSPKDTPFPHDWECPYCGLKFQTAPRKYWESIKGNQK